MLVLTLYPSPGNLNIKSLDRSQRLNRAILANRRVPLGGVATLATKMRGNAVNEEELDDLSLACREILKEIRAEDEALDQDELWLACREALRQRPDFGQSRVPLQRSANTATFWTQGPKRPLLGHVYIEWRLFLSGDFVQITYCRGSRKYPRRGLPEQTIGKDWILLKNLEVKGSAKETASAIVKEVFWYLQIEHLLN